MQEFTNGLVASRSAIRHGEGEHSGPAEDGVLVQTEAVNQSVSLLQTTIHGQGDPQGQTPQNLLVLRLLGILKKNVINKYRIEQTMEYFFC